VTGILFLNAKEEFGLNGREGWMGDKQNNRRGRRAAYLEQATAPLNAELNAICHLLVLLGARHILHISRIRVKEQLVLCPV